MSNVDVWHRLNSKEDAGEMTIPSRSLLRLLEEQVTRTPDAIALVFEGQELTYRELNARANQLAHHLLSLGVGPGILVGLCVERSLEMFVGLLAIFKAGGIYVPLDPDYPQERLNFILDDTQMSILLTQHHLASRFQDRNMTIVCGDADNELLRQQSQENLTRDVEGEQIAYVIYTSGSTGQPKGVLVSHMALAAHCLTIVDAFELCANDRILQFSAITFDPSLEQVMTTLLVGARLVVRGPEIWSPAEMLAKVKRYGLTILNLTPAYWHHMAQEWAALPHEELPTSLRLVTSGGDKLSRETVRNWRSTGLTTVRLINAYGPTEATITVALFDVHCWSEQAEAMLSGTIPIGHPLPQRKFYIIEYNPDTDSDQNRYQVPTGEIGELYIGGPLLARGYLNRPELTAERFLADPFSADPGARMYRTGDLVRARPDGSIEFMGRADQQVKIRGFRVELGEVEYVLNQHPHIDEAIVLAQEDASGDKMLVAYIIARSDQPQEASELRSYLRERVPEYMLPATFVFMDEFPLLPNGKIDRRGLPVAHLAKNREEENFVAPRLLLQQQLAQIWEDLLDIRPIGIQDNFFFLGGHSLLAARLVDRIEHLLGKRIALSTLFAAPTIEQLADALQEQEHTETRASLLPVQVTGAKRPLFFLHGDWTGGAFYCFTLGQALGPEQPLYVLEPYRFSGLQTLPSFEQVAAAHIAAIRAVQPTGPYLLGGFCNGGLFAYEMAHQLQADGEQVDFLGLITPTGPVQFKILHMLSHYVERLLPFHERQQIHLLIRMRHAVRHIYRHLRPSDPRVQDFHQLLAIDPRLVTMFPPLDALYNDYVGVFAGLVSRYETGVYDGKITFYWASEELDNERDWHPVTQAKNRKDIESYVIPGTHMSCVTDHIQELTPHFRDALRSSQLSCAKSPSF